MSTTAGVASGRLEPFELGQIPRVRNAAITASWEQPAWQWKSGLPFSASVIESEGLLSRAAADGVMQMRCDVFGVYPDAIYRLILSHVRPFRPRFSKKATGEDEGTRRLAVLPEPFAGSWPAT